MSRFSILVAVGLVAVGLVTAMLLPTSASGAEPASGTMQQRRAAKAVVAKYRRARRDMAGKQAAVAKAMTLGPVAVEPLLKIIEGEIGPKMKRYRQQFLKSAKVAASKKFQEASLEEVARLRQQVNVLRENPNLTKEQIVQQGDPAMKQLEELLTLKRETVLASNRRLVEQRQAMAGPGTLWEACQAYLAKLPSGTPGKAGEEKEKPVSFEEYLQQEETLAVRLAIPMSDRTRLVLAGNNKLASKIGTEESRCVLALNLTRLLLGLDPVSIDLQLVEVARGHSADMKKHKFFAHESPLPGKKTPWDRAKLGGTFSVRREHCHGDTVGHRSQPDVVSQSGAPSQHAGQALACWSGAGRQVLDRTFWKVILRPRCLASQGAS